MLKRIYITNFHTLQNFTLNCEDDSSLLLIGKNGTGKSTIAKAFGILKKIGNGEIQVENLIRATDFAFANTELPIRFEIETALDGQEFKYSIAFEFPKNFKAARIQEETLTVDGTPVFERKHGEIAFWYAPHRPPNKFTLDWHRVAVSLIGDPDRDILLNKWKLWLKSIIVLAPIPQMIGGESYGESDILDQDCRNFAEYLTGLLIKNPAIYEIVKNYLSQSIPDIDGISNKTISSNTRLLKVSFNTENKIFDIDFKDLSDGEKCTFICAVLIAALRSSEIQFVFWDEPDSHLSLWEVQQFILSLRQDFHNKGQIIITSHKAETINCFSPENILRLYRNSHLEPTRINVMNEIISDTDDIIYKIKNNEL